MAGASTERVDGSQSAEPAEIAGLDRLWGETKGDPRICIAVLDGPVDRSHPSLASANLTTLHTLAPNAGAQGSATRHGTHVASILFGQRAGPLLGLAPDCRGLLVPIYGDAPDGSIVSSTQLDLARAILLAAEEGAHIINVSGGEPSPTGTGDPLLEEAVGKCAQHGILIVAAAGNEGCSCLHVPGALPMALAVGAMDSKGDPLPSSNWGKAYAKQGILAPGERIWGAIPGGQLAAESGTSYATSIVSGIAALLLSLQLKMGRPPNPQAVRASILDSAVRSNGLFAAEGPRDLAGRLDVDGAMSRISEGEALMAEPADSKHAAKVGRSSSELNVHPSASEHAGPEMLEILDSGASVRPSDAAAPACSCGSPDCSCGSARAVQLVYALGQIGFDFGTQSRRDSIAQHMGGNPNEPSRLLAYLEQNPWDAEDVIWTLNLGPTPIYAVAPLGVSAEEGYKRIRQFLGEGVERISLPGVVVGTVRLLSGQDVPVVRPGLRCMYSWTTAALLEALAGEEEAKQEVVRRNVANFLERIYHELRNLGLTAQERAINYAATNALNAYGIFKEEIRRGRELDTIEVERSPIFRAESDCWDVKLAFFDPENSMRSRRVHRFTVDVSDVCPVTVGDVRSWSVR